MVSLSNRNKALYSNEKNGLLKTDERRLLIERERRQLDLYSVFKKFSPLSIEYANAVMGNEFPVEVFSNVHRYVEKTETIHLAAIEALSKYFEHAPCRLLQEIFKYEATVSGSIRYAKPARSVDKKIAHRFDEAAVILDLECPIIPLKSELEFLVKSGAASYFYNSVIMIEERHSYVFWRDKTVRKMADITEFRELFDANLAET